jgi:hypothetical protein
LHPKKQIGELCADDDLCVLTCKIWWRVMLIKKVVLTCEIWWRVMHDVFASCCVCRPWPIAV